MTDDAPGYTGEEHPELFSVIPPQPHPLKPGQVSYENVKQFYEDGYLLLEDFFAHDELSPSRDALNELVDQLATKLFNGGKIKSLYNDHGFESRLTMIEKEYPGANIMLHKLGSQPEAFSELWANEKLLNVVEQLLGTADISGLPAWNLRPKTPQSQATVVPWHQDAGYFDNSTYRSFIITAWIPLVDTTESNGCLQMIRGAHKKGKVAKHVGCWEDTWYIMLEEDEMRSNLGVNMEKDVVTCPVRCGECLLFTAFTPHRGLPNTSDSIRWSFDFRWQPAHCPPGMYGMKPSVHMRSSADPHFKIDWEPFISVDRRKKQFEMMKKVPDEFDTSNPGPWMLKWPLVHENRHTEALNNVDRIEWLNVIYG